ncbi:OmpA family protein [Flavobacterium sp. GT3R68]|uniref:OmpA family protein n=1 Tax=Flavobacterium sp. GT3R68 TaxID=2594437 RepID=UPI000F89A7B3|nr:OmpA family protein [Flavobacterium sp. GT3R68]RTY93714.1 OmpA family protein [Flavobacterium sp. GSN2]TRW91604.1 OmpA family protein [Flavobacterium sp. GT3R68]
MRKIVLSAILAVFSVPTLFAQDVAKDVEVKNENLGKGYNQWSIDINGGISKPTQPFTPDHFSDNTNLFHADLGARYMFNNKFGLKLDFGYDQFSAGDGSMEFDGQYFRTNIQGVANLGRIFNFEDWTKRVNLQVHAGPGYSFMTNDAFEGNDNMANFLVGLTGQIKLSERVAFNADFTMVNNISQSYTFDGAENAALGEDRGFDGTIFNASIGLSIYLGKNTTHADWYVEEKPTEKLAELENRIGELETMMDDSDKDGIVDHLDVEPNTIAGVAVDAKGRTIDTNQNGVPDELESYLTKTYGEGTTAANASQGALKELIDGGYVNIYFDTNSTTPSENSVSSINFLVKYLKANPAARADVIGFADEIGSTEYNNALSARRAESVKNILIAAGIDASRMDIVGNGEDTSVAKESKLARKIVRRVTFKIK